MKIKIDAIATRFYKDKNSNDYVQFTTAHGDKFSMQTKYCNPCPKEGAKVIIELEPKTYISKQDGQTVLPFMAFSLAHIYE